MGPDFKVVGVTFDSVRLALTDLFFRTKDMTPEQFEAAMQYVLPMQHNYMNPLKPQSGDTFIQYWIDKSDRIVEDRTERNLSIALKTAHITIRFLGAKAESWALSFHHLTKRRIWATILSAYCNGRQIKYVSPVSCYNVDYFGVGNTTKAFTVSFNLLYDEYIDFTEGSGGDELDYVNLAPGAIDREIDGGLDD